MIEHHPYTICSCRHRYIENHRKNNYSCQYTWGNLFSDSCKRENHINSHKNHSNNQRIFCGFLHIRSNTWSCDGLFYYLIGALDISFFYKHVLDILRKDIYLFIFLYLSSYRKFTDIIIQFYNHLTVFVSFGVHILHQVF